MSIFREVYKKAFSIINSPIDMLCEDGSMSVVPTNKAKEAVGVMQEEVARLEQQLAKANERADELLARVGEAEARLASAAITGKGSYPSDALNKFALEQKIEALDDLLEEIECSVVVPKRYEQLQEPYLEGIKHCIQFIECQSEQLRKEQEQ